jgi:hypothetical protein
LSLRGSNMSLDMRLSAVSDEKAVSEWSEFMAVGSSDPLVWKEAIGPAKTAAYVLLPSGARVVGWILQLVRP